MVWGLHNVFGDNSNAAFQPGPRIRGNPSKEPWLLSESPWCRKLRADRKGDDPPGNGTSCCRDPGLQPGECPWSVANRADSHAHQPGACKPAPQRQDLDCFRVRKLSVEY